jgi:proteasome lid subunit RPN8/RPN11
MSLLTSEVKQKILEHVGLNTNEESCGLLLERSSEITVRPCQNIAFSSKKRFIISPYEVAEARKEGEIIAFYHSHLDGEGLTELDKLISKKLMLPTIIYTIESNKFDEYVPLNEDVPLIGRPYFQGVFDCYSLIRDYYKNNLNLTLPDIWEFICKKSGCKVSEVIAKMQLLDEPDKNLATLNAELPKFSNLFNDFFIESGFVKVPELQKNDVIITNIPRFNLPIHAMLYLGGNTILHHPANRKSTSGPFIGFYKTNTAFFLRYKNFI